MKSKTVTDKTIFPRIFIDIDDALIKVPFPKVKGEKQITFKTSASLIICPYANNNRMLYYD